MNKNISKNKWILIVALVIETIMICIGVRRAVRQPVEIILDSDDFQEVSSDVIFADSDGLHSLGNDNGSVVIGNKFVIHSGAAYEIYAEYTFDSDATQENTCSIVFDLKDNEFNKLNQSDLFLYRDGVQSYGRIYAEGGGEAQAVLKYKKGEAITLKSIKIIERPVWQWLKLLLLLCVFTVVDIFIYKESLWKNIKNVHIGIIILTLFCAIPCMADFQYGGHDLPYHMQRIANVAKELSDGQIPVRLYSYVYNGYGYGAPLFYGDVFLYIPAILYNLMVPLYTCIHIYIFLISMITIITSYYCFKYISNNDIVALMGCFLYVFSPYRIGCIWVRAAFGEYTALAFLPLILWGMYAIWTEEKYSLSNSIILGSGVALTTFCHILSVELSLIPLILTVAFSWRKINKQRIKGIMVSILIFLGMSAWFIVPMIDSVISVGIKAFNSTIEKEIQDSGVYLIQLLNPFFSFKGANVDSGMRNEMPLSLGIGAIAGLLFPFIYMLDNRRKEKNVDSRILLMWLLGGLIAFMTTIHFPWSYISRMCGHFVAKWMNECQFTWRYMGIADLILIAVLCVLLEIISKDYGKEIKTIIMSSICIISIVATAHFFSNYVNYQEEYRTYAYWNYSEGYLLNFFSIDADTEGTGIEEADIELNNREAAIDNSSGRDIEISLPVYAYKNVRVRDKERGKEFLTHMNQKGMVSVLIPVNFKGIIQVYYAEPLVWRLSELLSIVVIVGILVMIKRPFVKDGD